MLPRQHRVSQRVAWQRLHARGRIVHSRDIVLKYCRTNEPATRIGFVVGTKVSKKATIRNQVKRRLRYIMHKCHDQLAGGYDIALLARPRSVTASYQELESQTLHALRQARLLKKTTP